jgi:hypothetical protein
MGIRTVKTILFKKRSKGDLICLLATSIITIILVICSVESYTKQDLQEKYNKYVSSNIPYTTEYVDTVLPRVDKSGTSEYIAILNAEQVNYQKISIEDNIKAPFITYQRVPKKVIEEYDIDNYMNKPFIDINQTLHIPKGYFKDKK